MFLDQAGLEKPVNLERDIQYAIESANRRANSTSSHQDDRKSGDDRG